MRAVKGQDTTLEIVIREICTSARFKFDANRTDLPGKPDLVFENRKKAIFANGCFWHGHNCARGARVPKTNRVYWVKKIARNRARDKKTKRKLGSLGWKTISIWECQIKDRDLLKARLLRFLRA